MPSPNRLHRRGRPLLLGAVALVALAAGGSGSGQEQAPRHRAFDVTADGFAFQPQRLEVGQDDLVKITFTAVDIAHSFTVDGYRISKRANAGQTVSFEFRADRPGRFPFYCNLTIDDRCREMRGELTVNPR